MMQRRRQIFTIHKNNHGFTFMELMVVIAIVGILASIAITSFKSARSKVLDAAALSETNSLGKVVINAFLDGVDIDLVHLPGSGPLIGTLDTSGNGRNPIFTLGNGVRAQIDGNSDFWGPGLGMCSATIWHPSGTKSYDLLIDENLEITMFPTF